jgi:hypothetical protein
LLPSRCLFRVHKVSYWERTLGRYGDGRLTFWENKRWKNTYKICRTMEIWCQKWRWGEIAKNGIWTISTPYRPLAHVHYYHARRVIVGWCLPLWWWDSSMSSMSLCSRMFALCMISKWYDVNWTCCSAHGAELSKTKLLVPQANNISFTRNGEWGLQEVLTSHRQIVRVISCPSLTIL